jgi:hypothetical protein
MSYLTLDITPFISSMVGGSDITSYELSMDYGNNGPFTVVLSGSLEYSQTL